MSHRNVILIMTDQHRWDYVGYMGHPTMRGLTPNLDRLAAEGVTFTRHLSVAPNTLPSTKSIFTGQAFLARGGWKLPSDGPETLAEVFRAGGYRTGMFGKWHLGAAAPLLPQPCLQTQGHVRRDRRASVEDPRQR